MEVSVEPSGPDLGKACSEYLTAHRARLEEAILSGRLGVDVAQQFAHMFDGLFSTLFFAASANLRYRGGLPGRVAVVAVGGYGRCLVAPHSDVDVLFVSEEPEDPRVVELAEAMLYPLWDSGVDVGHAVRGVRDTLELCRTDIRTSTTLLDMRHIAGDQSLCDELTRRGRELVFESEIAQFFEALASDTVARHERYGGTLYLREPELKLGRGGLRDLDVLTWMGRARWGTPDLEGLQRAGALSDVELVGLRAAREHLWRVRNHLHLAARRRRDRLTFEDQELIAGLLGHRDGVRLGVEQFMQEHYGHARAIARLVDMMGERSRRSMRPPPTTIRDLGGGLAVHDAHVIVDEAMLASVPSTALALYKAVQEQRLPPDPAARDAVAAACCDRDWCQRLRRDPSTPGLFLSLLVEADEAPLRSGSWLFEMHDLGLLLAMIPEFEPIMGRVRHDAYQAYTADIQAIKAVDRLRALSRGEHAGEYLAATRAAAEAPRPIPLHVALLLRSIGAGHPDDPARYAAALAVPIAERLGLSRSDAQHVEWLIQNQGSYYHWALRRDITDPETIGEVAGELGTIYRLVDLYLFTFCDVSTVNPRAMSAWNARMLSDLMTAVSSHIEGASGVAEQIRRLREEVLSAIADPGERVVLERFFEEMPERYLLANTAAGVRFHAQHAQRSGTEPAVAALPSGVGDDTLELMVVTEDRPGLLADIAAVLATGRFSVDSAQLYRRLCGDGRIEAFDLFHVSHISMGVGVDLAEEVERVRRNLAAVLSGELSAEQLIARLPTAPSWERSGPRVKTEVHVDNAASSRFTVVDVYTRDRDALLYAIAKALHEAGLSIAVAKVNTEGERVADVFYVEDKSGGKLAADGRLAKLSAALRRTIRALDRR
ncbi:MAG: [protein-PII] uridylyltransferase [Myxococcales bacterium]|nr:[protein-PII] uridylyltransferase [Myxococcales bacterium]